MASRHTNNILQRSEEKPEQQGRPSSARQQWGAAALSGLCLLRPTSPRGHLALPTVCHPASALKLPLGSPRRRKPHLEGCLQTKAGARWKPPGEGPSAAPPQGLGLTLGLLEHHSSFHSLHRPFQQLAGTNLAGLLKGRHGHFGLGAGGRAAGDAGELLGKESLRSRRSAAHGGGLTLTNPAPARLLALLLPSHPTEAQH